MKHLKKHAPMRAAIGSDDLEQDVFAPMESKYGPAFTQGIRDKLASVHAREVQYLEMKQMVDILFRFRERARAMLTHYRVWKRDFDCETDDVEKVYKSFEGILLRQQVRDAWKMYLTVNRDYHDMYRAYMAQIEDKKSKPFSYKNFYG